MQRFLLLYVGPATPPDASHEAWPEWFVSLGDQLLDRGSPIIEGRALRGDGSVGDPAVRLNGYGVIQAEDLDDALTLIGDHPYLTQGPAHSVEVHRLP